MESLAASKLREATLPHDEPQNISDILEELKATTDLGRRLEEAQIWEHWGAIAGSELAPHATPIGVRDGILVIAVDSAVWMHKFSYRKSEIIDKSNHFLTQDKLSEVFFTLKEDAAELPPETEP